jgi:polar amino acid transport system substrate-binding protein
MRISLLVGAVLVTAGLTACAPQERSNAPSTGEVSSVDCSTAKLPTLVAGRLTIATDDPVYPPWFADNKPSNGQGFEGAVAAAVASQLGYQPSQVTWARATFNAAIAPGKKSFDFDINEFSITDERKQAVDFSTPYYDVTQAVITIKGSKIVGARSLADLRQAKLGVQVGTTSYTAITQVIKPSVSPQVYNNTDDARKALQNRQIDGLVVDLPTAFYITSAELDDGVIVGQVPQPAGQPEQFGLLLDKGSPLTGCVSRAVDALRGAGTLDRLTQKWLAQSGAPVLS